MVTICPISSRLLSGIWGDEGRPRKGKGEKMYVEGSGRVELDGGELRGNGG